MSPILWTNVCKEYTSAWFVPCRWQHTVLSVIIIILVQFVDFTLSCSAHSTQYIVLILVQFVDYIIHVLSCSDNGLARYILVVCSYLTI